MRVLFFYFLTILVFTSCNNKIVQPSPEIAEATITETRQLDTLVVTAPKPDQFKTVQEFRLPDYNPSYKRTNDLLHTKLELRFDWPQQQVIGKATLTLKPLFYPTESLRLDAKGFDIHSVTFADSNTPLNYEYDGKELWIDLGKPFTREEKYQVFIDYTAKPAEGEIGGSAAITSDQGLFFINPEGKDPNKPMQIWTQGETEFNSRWFPTIDKPNERTTQETYLTVKDQFKTLSNGVLISSIKNKDGTRTDYWKMDQAHAPYLFMVAVGDFAVVSDKWKGIPVDYYVEPEYRESARGIFGNTVEMLDFFSDKLGVDYPWPKYAQIVVRDYVSGAMENTSAVIFGEFVQKTNRELIDNHNDGIVAHEMFHHWFGDLVTTESWANLTMNEGFANYSEYLWFEHKYGRDEADYHRYNEMQGYLNSAAQQGIHPLIYFDYKNKEDMFDAHSYNKGGLVLHMLRNYVGEDAFFAALKLYLDTHKYTSVEAHDLRLAFEDVTGEDLNWFFNQWYFNPGHPELQVAHEFDAETSSVVLTLEQTQNTDRMPAIFELPLAVELYFGDGSPMREKIRLTKRKQLFRFKVPEEPKLVLVDADNILLAEKQEKKTEEEYIFQYYHAPHFLDQFEATRALVSSNSKAARQVFEDALSNDFWVFRAQAIEVVDLAAPGVLDRIFEMAKSDPHSSVRTAAMEKLAESGDKKYIAAAVEAIEKEKAYPVIYAALQTMRTLDFELAKAYAKKLENEDYSSLVDAVASIYAESGDHSTLDYFEKNINNVDGYDALSFMSNYIYLAKTAEGSALDHTLMKLKEVGTNMAQSPWRRLAATKSLFDLSQEYSAQLKSAGETNDKTRLQQKIDHLAVLIRDIVSNEENDQLKTMYKQLQGV